MKKAIYDNPRQAILYAYLAGIIDGEGTIRIGKGQPKEKHQQTKYYASISIGMSGKKVIELVAKEFGSKMRIYKECVSNRKIIYRWGTSGNKVVPQILNKIMPYLIEKKKQAELVKEFCEEKHWREKIDKKRKCRKCGKKKNIQGYGLCINCYMFCRRHHITKYKRNHNPIRFIPIWELQRRKELYLKVRELNAVGAAAETNQEHA